MIPMGGPLPVLGQPTVAFGAAAIMVHPASGYMINRVFLQVRLSLHPTPHSLHLAPSTLHPACTGTQASKYQTPTLNPQP